MSASSSLPVKREPPLANYLELRLNYTLQLSTLDQAGPPAEIATVDRDRKEDQDLSRTLESIGREHRSLLVCCLRT